MKKPVVNEQLLEHFNQGYAAFSRVVKRKKFYHQWANPLKKGTTGHKEWQRGWNAAYFENLEKLNGLRNRG